MILSAAQIGFLRGLGVVLLAAGLTYLGDAAHLPFLSAPIADLVAMVALALEHSMASGTSTALFGAVSVK